MEKTEKKMELQVTVQEKRLLEVIRQMNYGEISVFIKEGKPIRLEEIRKSIQL